MHLKNRLPCNTVFHLVDGSLSVAEALLRDQFFDVIVVDGLDRCWCAQYSLRLLAPNGAIIVDDSERSCGAEPGFRISDRYRKAGYSRVDFYGYSPGNTTQHCTSLFFRKDCFLFAGEEDPRMTLSFWEDCR